MRADRATICPADILDFWYSVLYLPDALSVPACRLNSTSEAEHGLWP